MAADTRGWSPWSPTPTSLWTLRILTAVLIVLAVVPVWLAQRLDDDAANSRF